MTVEKQFDADLILPEISEYVSTFCFEHKLDYEVIGNDVIFYNYDGKMVIEATIDKILDDVLSALHSTSHSSKIKEGKI